MVIKQILYFTVEHTPSEKNVTERGKGMKERGGKRKEETSVRGVRKKSSFTRVTVEQFRAFCKEYGFQNTNRKNGTETNYIFPRFSVISMTRDSPSMTFQEIPM